MADPYEYLINASQFADQNGFTAVWLPERHFVRFGGAFPNPSVLAAALAMKTCRIAIRAGSVVLPLHDVLRIREEWAVVDQLSNGRVGMAIAAGWNPDDFVLGPSNFTDRYEIAHASIEQLKILWEGGSINRVNGVGNVIQVAPRPAPKQLSLPIWLTTSTLAGADFAGTKGYGILTASFAHNYSKIDLQKFIKVYRSAAERSGQTGYVTLMSHCFVTDNETVCPLQALENYFIENQSMRITARASWDGLAKKNLSAKQGQILARIAAMRAGSSGLTLIGSSAECRERMTTMAEIGIDEIACMTDFGVDSALALESLRRLTAIFSASNKS